MPFPQTTPAPTKKQNKKNNSGSDSLPTRLAKAAP